MRLFISINFFDEILNILADFQDRLRASGLRGRYAPVESLHLTLAFIGEYSHPEKVIDAIKSTAFEPFQIRLDGMGNFNDLYWVGISKNEKLFNYVKKIRHMLAENGIPYDKKRFSPHITIVRSAKFYGNTELPTEKPPSAEMEVRKISLMKSVRGKNGMIYTEINS